MASPQRGVAADGTADGRLPLFDHYVIYSAGAKGVQQVHHFSTMDEPVPQNTAVFAFPEICDLQAAVVSSESSKVQSYSFMMCDSKGRKKYGLCRRYYVMKKGNKLQECVVIVSHYPWFSLFSKVAEVSLAYRPKGVQQVSLLLQDVIMQPFPVPGEAISVYFGGKRHQFLRPDDGGYRGTQGVQGTNMLFSDPDFLPLFRQLDVNDVLQLLACLLGECRIIMHSKNIGMLSSCTQASLALIFPFFWQHLFVPVVPSKMLDMCCAPMPFVFGVLTDHIPAIKRLPIEEVVFVDLDNATFENLEACSVELPGRYQAKLQSSLVDTIRQFKRERKFNSPTVARHFLDFFVDIFGSYRLFMRKQQGKNKKPLFDEEKFVDSHSGSSQDFVRQIQGSQLYMQWVEERPHSFENATSTSFEQAAIAVHNLHNKLDSGDKLVRAFINAKEVLDYKLKKNFSDDLDHVNTTQLAVGKSSVWDQGERDQILELEEEDELEEDEQLEDEEVVLDPEDEQQQQIDEAAAAEDAELDLAMGDMLLLVESDQDDGDDLLMGATPNPSSHDFFGDDFGMTSATEPNGVFGDDIFGDLDSAPSFPQQDNRQLDLSFGDLGGLFSAETTPTAPPSDVFAATNNGPAAAAQDTSLDDILNLI